MRQPPFPMFPLTVALVLISLGLFGYGVFLHTAPPAQTTAAAKTAAAAKRHPKTSAAATKAAPSPRTAPDTAYTFLLAGGAGLFLSALCGLGAARRQPSTIRPAVQTKQPAGQGSSEWEKQRRELDAQKQQLQAQLQEAQKSKAEMDSLRQNASRQFQEFFRTLPVACFCFAADGKIVRWNAACETLYGVPTAEAMAQTLWETLVPPESREIMEAWMSRVLAGESVLAVERMDCHQDGTALLVLSSMVPLRDASGGIIGGLSASLNVTTIRQQEGRAADLYATLQETAAALASERQEVGRLTEALADAQRNAFVPDAAPTAETEAERDVITGLVGREAFCERLRVETERAARYHTALSVVMLDLDGFTKYNQAQSTDAGDAALHAVAGLIENKLRTVDVAARYGADEYGLILPETGQAGAGVAAERLRSGLAGLAWPKQPLTACFGIAVLTPDVSSPEELAARASEALRCAKSLGVNSIVQHSEMPAAGPAKRPRAPRTKKAEAVGND